ncbi:uncharacterized protein [Clytia hemisphaerica]
MKMQGLSELHCVMECSNDHQCGSINHKGDQQLCELNQHREEDHQHTTQLQDEQGWNHFIKDKQKTVNTNDILMPTVFRPRQNHHLVKKFVYHNIWELSFDFKLFEEVPHWVNIVSFQKVGTTYYTQYGNRIPSIWTFGRKMYFFYPDDTNPNQDWNLDLNLQQTYSFKMRQTTHTTNENIKHIAIYVNRERVHYRKFTLNLSVDFVECFLTGILWNFRYTQSPIYPGQRIYVPREEELFKEINNWPPKEWFVSFDYQLTYSAQPNYWLFILMFSGGINQETNNREKNFVRIQRPSNALALNVRTWTSTSGAQLLTHHDLTNSLNTYIKCQMQQQRDPTDGKLYVTFWVDGQLKGTRVLNENHQTFQKVRITSGYSNLPHGVEWIDNLKYGEL